MDNNLIYNDEAMQSLNFDYELLQSKQKENKLVIKNKKFISI